MKSLTILFVALLLAPISVYGAQEIPEWIRNNAGWWAQGQITDSDFISGIQYLIKVGVLSLNSNNDFSHNSIKADFSETLYQQLKQELSEIAVTEYDVESSFPNNNELYPISETSDLFNVIGEKKFLVSLQGKPVLRQYTINLKPELLEAGIYDDIAVWNDVNPPVVIKPLFTSSAYWKPGFYNFYRQECDERCLITKIEYDKHLGTVGSAHAAQVLELLGYSIVTDVDVDKNPDILKKYDTVILLHNEYVTKKMFNAIISHPHVVYLYPNALYAEIESDYSTNSIKLIRGHGFPEKTIKNGFDWKNDNSPYEYDRVCNDRYFYEIENGFMLTCFPELIIYKDYELLKAIKDSKDYRKNN